MVEFNLRKGMKDEQILDEMTGKTSGESRQETSQILAYNLDGPGAFTKEGFSRKIKNLGKKEKIEIEIPEGIAEDTPKGIGTRYHPRERNLEILAVKEEDLREVENEKEGNNITTSGYALLKETKLTRSGGTTRLNRPVYYLVGVNTDDERKYFIHRLDDNDVEGIAEGIDKGWDNKTSTMDELIRIVNRTDDGFTTRIQGDLVMRLVDNVNKSSDGSYPVIEPAKNFRVTLYDFDHVVSTNYGRHEISTDGFIDELEVKGSIKPIAIVGTEFTINHPEHDPVTYPIPKGKIALITMQRGTTRAVRMGNERERNREFFD